MTNVENDIGTALMHLRAAFIKNGIPMPDVLEYSDTEKGHNASDFLRQHLQNSQIVQSQAAKPYAEMNIAGVTIRFEGRKMAKPEGGYDLL